MGNREQLNEKIKGVKERIKNLEKSRTCELTKEQKRDTNLKINALQKELSSLKEEYAYQVSIAREFSSAMVGTICN